MKNIKVIKVLMQTCLGLRYGYVQQITPKSIVIIKSENETEVFNRKTGRPRPEPKLQSAKDNQPKILSLPAIEEFIASRARIERDLNPRFNSKFNSRNKRKLINHELVDDKFDGHNIQKCFNCWHGNWMPDSNEKVTLLSARYLNTIFTFMSMQSLIILFDTRTAQKETVMIMNAGSSLKVSKS